MKWLITGGCGFLGTSLIRYIRAEGGHTIRVVDNLSVGTREDLAAVCDFVELDPTALLTHHSSCAAELLVGDILDEQLALKAAWDMDVIVHLAANTGVGPSVENPRSDAITNIIGTLNYLEAARYNHVKRFILASSGATIGDCAPPIHEEMAPHPVSPYGASKLAGEGYCSVYFRTFGVETVVLRFGNVYGPGSSHKNSVVAKFIRQALHHEALEIYGSGRQTRDFIYIDDLVRAIHLAVTTTEVGGEVLQIASSAETEVAELVNKLLPILADAGIREVEVRYTTPRSGEVLHNYSDTSKARQRLGWQAQVDLVSGLRRTVEWFLTHVKMPDESERVPSQTLIER